MSGSEQSAELRRWLRYAQEDLAAARALDTMGEIAPRHVCWLSQQSAEKALKALLMFAQRDVPRSHDLDLLVTLLPDDWEMKSLFESLAELTAWSIEARYPDTLTNPTSEDAARALHEASIVLNATIDELRKHGFDVDQ